MAAPLLIIPQKWVDGHRRLPDGWLNEHAPALVRYWPQIPSHVRYAARMGEIDERLLVCIMQREQSAITYAWDNSAHSYPGGDRWKLTYLCGVDRMDGGNDRVGGWFGPREQLLGCALRFGWWYHGQDGPLPGHENWLHLTEDPRYQAGVPVTREGRTIIPANWASAQSLRYCTSMSGQDNLRAIGLRWFPEDYNEEATTVATERQVSLEQLRKHLEGLKNIRRIDEVVVHHCWKPDSSDYRGIETVRGVRRYHVETNGWSDNGYHLMLAPDGTIYLCRPIERPGAHTSGHNQHSIGVSFIANFDAEEPKSYGGLLTGYRVVAALLERFNLDIGKIRFHREFASKTCPGLKLGLTEFRQGVFEQLGRLDASSQIIAKKVVRWPGYEPNADLIFHDGRHYMAVADVPRLIDEVELIDRREEDGKLYLKRRRGMVAAAEPTALAEGAE